MEIPMPSGTRTKSVFASPYRRRRLAWGVVLLLVLLFVFSNPFSSWSDELDHHGHTSRFSWGSSRARKATPRVSELHGLLHMVAVEPDRMFDAMEVDVRASLPMSAYTGRESMADAEWVDTVRKLHAEYPVIVFSKTYCGFSRKAKDLLNSYDLQPPPKVVEVDLREDQNLIKGLLSRLSGRATFPNIFLLDISLGGSDDLQRLHESGELRQRFEAAGVEVRGDVGHGPAV